MYDRAIICVTAPLTTTRDGIPPQKELNVDPKTQWTDANYIIRLDGPGALHHLDTLLGLPELHAIQWVPGAGNEGIMQWIPLLQRIQSSGKGVQVHCRPEEVEPLMKQVRPEGLCIVTGCGTEKEARELLKLVARLSKQGRKVNQLNIDD